MSETKKNLLIVVMTQIPIETKEFLMDATFLLSMRVEQIPQQ